MHYCQLYTCSLLTATSSGSSSGPAAPTPMGSLRVNLWVALVEDDGTTPVPAPVGSAAANRVRMDPAGPLLAPAAARARMDPGLMMGIALMEPPAPWLALLGAREMFRENSRERLHHTASTLQVVQIHHDGAARG
jgi:hypothetical protein